MTPAEIKPSPDGVPGALTDPRGLLAEDLTHPGAEATQLCDRVVPFLQRQLWEE